VSGEHAAGPTSLLPPADGYAYVLPAGWLHLDIRPEHRAESVRRAVRRRVTEEPALRPRRSELQRLLERECALAWLQGAQRVSLLAERDGESVATAAVTLVVTEVAGFDLQTAARDGGRIVALAQQPAVRLSWTSRAPASGAGEPVASRCWQLLVPWPGRARVALLTMASPYWPLWSLLEATFDACAQTFHWTWSSTGAQEASD
jgi:hypothetical protein